MHNAVGCSAPYNEDLGESQALDPCVCRRTPSSPRQVVRILSALYGTLPNPRTMSGFRARRPTKIEQRSEKAPPPVTEVESAPKPPSRAHSRQDEMQSISRIVGPCQLRVYIRLHLGIIWWPLPQPLSYDPCPFSLPEILTVAQRSSSG